MDKKVIISLNDYRELENMLRSLDNILYRIEVLYERALGTEDEKFIYKICKDLNLHIDKLRNITK